MSVQPRRALFPLNAEQKPSSSLFSDEELAKLSMSIVEKGVPAASTPKHDENRPPNFAQISRIGSPPNSVVSNRFNFKDYNTEAVHKRPKSSNSSVSSRVKGVFGVSRSRNTVYFGFVAIGESQTLEHKLVNHSGEQLRLRYSLGSQPSFFEITSVSSLIVQPNQELVICIKYSPQHLEQHTNLLFIERINGDYQKFSFKLLGYGGRANVSLSRSLFDNGVAQETPSGVIVLTPDFYPPLPSAGAARYDYELISSRCYFELINSGDRASFISIQAMDKQGQELPSHLLSVQPARFILHGKTNASRKIVIKRNELYNENMRRESGVSTASTHPVDECGFRLVVIWGEEHQRIRFRNWQNMLSDNFLVFGQNFGDVFEGENKNANQTVVPLMDRPFDHEGNEFKGSLRMIKINIIDNCAVKVFPHGLMSMKGA